MIEVECEQLFSLVGKELTRFDTYKYKDNYYWFNEFCKSKNDTTGEWVDSVLYRQMGRMDIYCREKQDFINKFMLVIKNNFS